LAGKSSIDDVAAVGAAHMEKDLLGEAMVGTAAGVEHSTFVGSAVIATLARRTCGVGRVQRERQQRLGSSIEECGRI
jgi:hypothetical protein